MTTRENRPAGNRAASTDCDIRTGNNTCYAKRLRARRAASWRLPVLESRRSDPWWYEPPGERGYPETAAHLLSLGLTPGVNRQDLRAMWKAGGESRAAQVIAERWELAA